MWLPETEDRPVRPDLPWLRNLSWVKIHAMQIGAAVGLMVYWGQAIGEEGLVFGFVLLALEAALSLQRKGSNNTPVEHPLGIHDLTMKPWYGISAAVATWLAFSLIVGVP